MAALRRRRAGETLTSEEEAAEPEVVTPLEEQIAHFYESPILLEGFSVAIHAPAIEMPLLKRLGAAGFVPPPGLEALLHEAYQTISKKAIEVAYQESDGEE